MKSLFWDLLILTAFGAVVTAIMLFPSKQHGRLEKNWGAVHYETPVTKDQATKALDTLVKSGLYNGEQELTHVLKKVVGSSDQPETLVWGMVYEKNYRDLLGKEIIRNAILQLHAHVYGNQRLTVTLVDKAIPIEGKTEQIKQAWGSVLFDSPIPNEDAKRFAQAITATGGYNGTIHMMPNGNSVTYQVERDPAVSEAARNLVASTMQELVVSTFPDDRIRVELVDLKFEPFEVLIEPMNGKNDFDK